MGIYPKNDNDTRMERYIMGATPSDWSEKDARAFARKMGPRLLESLNAAIRAEVTARDQRQAIKEES